MSRGSTGRDFCMPGGYDTAVTAAGNIMLCRVMILYTIAIARGLLAILEQPSSSLMQHHWRFQQLIRNHAMYMTHHYLGYFLAESPKPIKLYSNWPILQTVNNYKTRSWLPESEGVYQQWVGDDGRKRVAGDTGLKTHRPIHCHLAEQLLESMLTRGMRSTALPLLSMPRTRIRLPIWTRSSTTLVRTFGKMLIWDLCSLSSRLWHQHGDKSLRTRQEKVMAKLSGHSDDAMVVTTTA